MDEQTFIFFDKRSGQILATHVQVTAEGQGVPVDLDELRRSYRAFPGQEIDPDAIDVLDVDLELLRRSTSNQRFVVDLDTRTLVRRDEASDAS
jgi:hypothetical protein